MPNKQYKAIVKFGKNDKITQKSFLEAMNGARLIQVSQEWIDIWYKDDTIYNPNEYENSIVLHNDEELERFKLVMKTFFSEILYQIDAL